MMNWLMSTIPSGATHLQVIILSAAAILVLSWFTTMVANDLPEMWKDCFPEKEKTMYRR